MKNRKYTQDIVCINPLDIKIRQKTIYYKPIEYTKHIHITSMTYYIIRQGINETCPHTTLYNTIDQSTWTPSPSHWPQVYIAPLHHNSIIYRQMQTYQGQMAPLINPKCTEPHYIKTVVPIDKGTWIPLIKPRAPEPDYTAEAAPLIEPKCTEPYYTKRVLPIVKATWTPLIDPKCT